MARLTGLTIDIGGNTEKLNDALKNPTKNANELQGKLKEVNTALKLDPTNTELLSQKQKLLAESVDSTKDKLSLLKQAQKEFKDSGGDLNSKAYIQLETDIAKTEASLRSLEGQQTKVNTSFQKMSIGAEKFGNNMKSAASKTRGVSTAAAGLTAAAFATVPATEELRTDLSKLDNNAREAGIGMDVSRKAFETFNVATDETDSSVEATSNLLQAGFTESNLQKAVEGLTGAYLKFPDTLKIESLADSLQETLASGKATGQFGELLDRLGVGADNFSEELAKCSTQAEKQNLALKVLSENGLMDSYNGWKNNNKELVASKEASFKFQEASAKLAETLTPVITGITEVITKLINGFNNLSPTMQNVVLGGIGLTAALSPVLNTIGNLSLGISNMIPLFSQTGTGLSTMGTMVSSALASLGNIATTAFNMLKTVALGAFNAIMAHPIIAGITAIIAIIVTLYTKCEWFRDAVNALLGELWEGIKNVFETIKNFLFKTVPESIDGVISFFSEMPGGIMGVIANLPIMLMDMGKDMILKLVDGIASVFGLPKEKVHQITEGLINVVQALPRAFFNWGKEMVENLGKGIEAAKDWVVDKAHGLADGIASFLHFTKPDTGPLRDYETWMPDFINGMAKGIHDNIGILKNASANVASVLTVEPAAPGMAGTSTATGSGLSELISSLKDSINLTSSVGNQKKGDTIMPIYIGNRLLDEIILDSNARQVVKSGGR